MRTIVSACAETVIEFSEGRFFKGERRRTDMGEVEPGDDTIRRDAIVMRLCA